MGGGGASGSCRRVVKAATFGGARQEIGNNDNKRAATQRSQLVKSCICIVEENYLLVKKIKMQQGAPG